MQLHNRVAIITGGASGLGKATAQQLVAAGAKVALFDIQAENAQRLVEELGAEHCLAFTVDVTNEESVAAGIEATKAAFGNIHICVNCAGSGDAIRTVGKKGPFPLDRFEWVVKLNLIGTFNVLRLCAAEMQHNEALTEDGERGVIINTGSVAGIDGQIGQAAYAASKAGVIGMTLPIARDLGKLGIRINTICPGVFKTELMAMAPQEMQDNLAANAQFPPRLGKPQEFAKLVKHLCENEYINAETIRLDAAMRMPPR
ncbi:MAG: SDR family NAD(P)-dependent oxidoreductase [Spongiibacter marinus]|uniref:SDR family NAD(P)-dependent oxidoreductase n=1 Tax=Spongiibacter marinus TaxID=354246 RepID=UPI003C3B175A